MIVLLILLIVSLGLLVYMFKQAFENHVLHHELQLSGKDEKVSLFFISDVHVRKINSEMMNKINKKIDAVIIGGDFADKRTSIKRINENIDLLKILGPVYFVWGNNDREVGESTLRKIFSEKDVVIIENDATLIPNIENRCWISAVDDTSSRNVRIEDALKKCSNEDLVIFISHNPEVFAKVKQKENIKLKLGGHFHGGQIRIGPLGMHQHGYFKVDKGVATLISNGYGTSMLPLRLGAKPQCHIIDLIIMK
ncbi:predicted MPP superfamily phosphohydrolase [Ureibacillus xyleni]|uniref:Predicted MPP superfamily phosphohydrolase n=1 Tax=Ureibacillus xyleni TaxID=614648 RepID=A0A285RPL0_9BACL|nr:metallophosphoesterase [Ureibacillus xyleni]SOB94267.1 predicted MPP superfamily phosphohydrolase [Ureibacillus xyleni]